MNSKNLYDFYLGEDKKSHYAREWKTEKEAKKYAKEFNLVYKKIDTKKI